MSVPDYLAPQYLRVIAGAFMPGLLAMLPIYAWVYKRLVWIQNIIDKHPWFIIAVLVMSAYLAGLIVSSIGTQIEGFISDEEELHESDANKKRLWEESWKHYLFQDPSKAPIIHKYIGLLVTWLKFKASMIPSLIIALLGALYYRFQYGGLTCSEAGSLVLIVLFLIIWLWEGASATVIELHKLRTWILEKHPEREVSTRPTST